MDQSDVFSQDGRDELTIQPGRPQLCALVPGPLDDQIHAGVQGDLQPATNPIGEDIDELREELRPVVGPFQGSSSPAKPHQGINAYHATRLSSKHRHVIVVVVTPASGKKQFVVGGILFVALCLPPVSSDVFVCRWQQKMSQVRQVLRRADQKLLRPRCDVVVEQWYLIAMGPVRRLPDDRSDRARRRTVLFIQ